MLWALFLFHVASGKLHSAREIAEQYRALAERTQQPALLLETCHAMGVTLMRLGDLRAAQPYLERGITLYDPQHHHALIFEHGGADLGIHTQLAILLWLRGHPAQARAKMHDTLSLAHQLSHPFSLGFVLYTTASLHQRCGERQATQERAEEVLRLSREQGFPSWLAVGTLLQGWALAEQGQAEKGLAQMRQGLAAWQTMGTKHDLSYFLALLAGAYAKVGQTEEGLSVVAEALTVVDNSGERYWEAEVYRLKGELTLQQSTVQSPKSPVWEEGEACFQQAIAIARPQKAKALELRATTNLARLWQRQGKKQEARDLLAPVYHWFTEGFDTADLKAAKSLLDELT